MICILLSVRYSVTAFVATIGTIQRDMGSILPVAHCGNLRVRFSTFFILENVGKI